MQRLLIRTTALTLWLALALGLASSPALAQYKLTNLTSNQSGKAKHTDPLLQNAWGLAYAPGAPFWVSDEWNGWSTLYDGAGVPQTLQVIIPPASGSGPGSPTGLVYNGSNEFQIDSWTSALFVRDFGWDHPGLVAFLSHASAHRGEQLRQQGQLYRLGHHQQDARGISSMPPTLLTTKWMCMTAPSNS